KCGSSAARSASVNVSTGYCMAGAAHPSGGGGQRRLVREPERADLADVAVIGAAAAAEEPYVRHRAAQLAVLPRELAGIARVELLGLVELGVALLRGVRADAAEAADPVAALLDHRLKM